jgi:hypothetical protein
MTRLVKAELLKLRTTRTARTLLALAAAGTRRWWRWCCCWPAAQDSRSWARTPCASSSWSRPSRSPWPPWCSASSAWPGSSGTAPPPRPSWSPRVRGRVVAAKLAAAAATGLAMALVASAAVFAVGLPWLKAKGIEVAVADAGLLARVAGLAVAVALFAVLGVGLAALLRNQVAAVIVGLLWWSQGVERILVAVLHQPGLERWLPRGAASALTAPGDATLPMWAGGLVFAAYGLVLALAGGRLVARRDLT